MKKPIFSFFFGLILYFSLSPAVYALTKESGSTGMLLSTEPTIDVRVIQLQNYLAQYNPGLVSLAATFVAEADLANIDWKLVPAIAGLESTFCKRIPSDSYNCWGWGIPTGSQSGVGFKSYADGIRQVSQGLRTRYYDRGCTTLNDVGHVYAASPTWAIRVRFFMQAIEDWQPKLIAFNQVLTL